MSAQPGASIALDVHAHLIPVMPERLAGIAGVEWNAADEALIVDGHAVALKSLFRPPAFLRWMDGNRVERAWISVPPPAYRQGLDLDAARLWTGYLNDGLAEIAARFPGRLAPLFHLPLEKPALAAEIAQACCADGARGFSAPAGGETRQCLSDPALDPLWACLDRASAFLFLHPGACGDGRLRSLYLENLLGNPYETSVAAAHLVLGGVCERFPGIRFCLAHGGGATAMAAGRLQQGFDTKRPGLDTGRAEPRAILRRLLVDCILHDAEALGLAAHVFGEDHILFGSDWPFPMGLLSPHDQLAACDPVLRRRILWENAANGPRDPDPVMSTRHDR